MCKGITYRWKLLEGSKKFICPSCGKKTFVPYVAAGDVNIFADEKKYGRCDREINCGYICYPKANDARYVRPAIERVRSVTVENRKIRFDQSVVITNYSSNLYAYAYRLFGEELAKEAWQRYHIGAYNGKVIFWQIDRHDEVRTGKIMQYDSTGHRDKLAQYSIGWVHRMPNFKDKMLYGDLEQCLFGEHLLFLPENIDKEVAIVESEKSAVMMSIVDPSRVWVATSGLSCMTADKLKVLEDRTVRLYPDNGCDFIWASRFAKNAPDIEAYSLDHTCETHPIFEGCDIWDIYEQKQIDYNEAHGIKR